MNSPGAEGGGELLSTLIGDNRDASHGVVHAAQLIIDSEQPIAPVDTFAEALELAGHFHDLVHDRQIKGLMTAISGMILSPVIRSARGKDMHLGDQALYRAEAFRLARASLDHSAPLGDGTQHPISLSNVSLPIGESHAAGTVSSVTSVNLDSPFNEQLALAFRGTGIFAALWTHPLGFRLHGRFNPDSISGKPLHMSIAQDEETFYRKSQVLGVRKTVPYAGRRSEDREYIETAAMRGIQIQIGNSVDRSVYMRADDTTPIERLPDMALRAIYTLALLASDRMVYKDIDYRDQLVRTEVKHWVETWR